MLAKLGWLALAGAVGTLARYGMIVLIGRWSNSNFPWGTLVVNLTGCFLFGLVWGLSEARLPIHHDTRLIVLTGFMGAFTTFSTFGFETIGMFRTNDSIGAIGNLLAHNGLGLLAILLGTATGRL